MDPFYYFTKLNAISGCRHAITTKKNSEPYSFSVALHTGENPQIIIVNRKKILKQLHWSEKLSFIVANQTHSDHIHIVRNHKNRGWEDIKSVVEDCDALITNRKDIVLTMLTADCVPILLIDPIQNVIAAVHAGWKGSKENILFKTVKKMCDTFDCDSKNILAGIGPAIGVCCYEVNTIVAKNFDESDSIITAKDDKYMLDLPSVNQRQLLEAGILESNIEMSHICTACEVDRFFSYRKEKGCSGRFMSMIRLQ
jgi:YfiH family protein